LLFKSATKQCRTVRFVPQVVSKARFRHEDKFFAHLMEKRLCDKEDMRKLSVGCSIRLETDGPKTTLEGVVVA
jgi:hypothetical protein